MKTFLLVLLMLFVCAANVSAQNIRLGQPASLAWDYTLADITAGAVVRFETQVDTGGAWISTGLPVPSASYLWPIPQALLTLGTHAISVRACSATECGPSALINVMVTALLPVVPANPRLVPGAVPVTGPAAVQLAHAYALLAIGRTLTNEELTYLSLRVKDPQSMTVGDVLALMDSQYATLLTR